MEKLVKQRFYQMADIPDHTWDDFFTCARITTLAPGEELPRDYAGYIITGLIRAYYIQEDGRQWNRDFVGENDLICYMTMIQNDETEDLIIESIEETTLVLISQKDLERFYDLDASWGRVGRMISEEAYRKKLRRERQLLSDDLAGRYQQFLKDYSPIANRVPQHMIASFLGSSPVSLSSVNKFMS